jgi:tripartite motif-containing protein 71
MIRRAAIVGLMALLAGMMADCTRPPREVQPTGGVARTVPDGLVVEKEISGTVLSLPLRNPCAIAVDNRGQLFVCDAGNNRLIKFGPDFAPIKDHGGFGSGDGLLSDPSHMALDNNLNLWVSESGNRRISRYDLDLNFVDKMSFIDDSDLAKFGTPSGVAVTQYGTMWVADKLRQRVAIFNNIGTFEQFIGEFGSGGGQLLQPEKVVCFGREEFAVCDAGNARVLFYDSYGTFAHEFSDNSLSDPVACAVSGKDLWIADRKTARIMFVADMRKNQLELGPNITGSTAPLNHPSDLAVLPNGRLAIADSGNNRILICRIIYPQP